MNIPDISHISDSIVANPFTASSRNTSPYIHPSHLEEWVNKSGVSEQITRSNVKSLEDKQEIAQHLGWKKYTHPPGWWCSGINPRNGLPMGMMHGQFKPDKPIKFPKSDKPAKYLSSKAQYDAICLNTGNPRYWSDIIQDESIPVFITEGCKKAGAGLTNGYPTLALCGVEMGLDDGELVSHLALFAKPGRCFYLCFDADIVRKISVQKALFKLSKVLSKAGCTVQVVMWDESKGKGMDDFIVANGKPAFDIEIAKAQRIEEWEKQFKHEEKHEQDKKIKLPEHSFMAEILAPQLNNIKFDCKLNQWIQYQNGYWRIISSKKVILKKIIQKIKDIYPNQGFYSSYPEGVMQLLISELLLEEYVDSYNHLLPFKNGVLDLKTNQLIPHSPNYYFRNIIDREHDPNATDWSKIEEWMDFIFENNPSQKRLLICWYAAVLRGMWEIHRFALIIGLGGTGKSTAMKLAIALIGQLFSHSLSITSLNNNPFQTANIYDKRLVCINDADRYKEKLEILKNITGGDAISIEDKFEKAFSAIYKGMLMITANNFIFPTNDSGLNRRIIIFKLDRQLANIDTNFLAKLTAQISGFTNYLLSIPESEIVHTLLYKVDESGTRKQNDIEALLQTNSVADWLNNNYVYDPDKQLPIGVDKDNINQLYGNYCIYCHKTRSKPCSNKDFSREIIELGRGKLEKVKTRSGLMIRGLRRDDLGGLIESIIHQSPPC
jgi:putative DNA primase/helicase